MNSEFGILYLIPCPISDETAPWDVLPAANRAVMDALDYFIVENTRTARRFLSKAGIARPIGELEFRELNEHTAAGRGVLVQFAEFQFADGPRDAGFRQETPRRAGVLNDKVVQRIHHGPVGRRQHVPRRRFVRNRTGNQV